MDNYDRLWEFFNADMELEKYESELKSTETRRKLLKLQKYIQEYQQLLKNLEGDMLVKQNEMSEITTQYDKMQKQLRDGKEELDSMAEDEPGELDLNYVRELLRNFESTYESIVKFKKQISSIKSSLEKWGEDIRKILINIQKAKRQFDTLKEIYDAEMSDVAPNIERRKQEIAKLSKQVDPELLKRYMRIKKNRKDPVAMIVEGKCSGCNMALPSGDLLSYGASKKVLECENCGRILIMSAKG